MSDEDASAEIEPTRSALPDSLDGLAAVAVAEHEAFERDARSAIGHAIRAGEALIAAKGKVRHGEWLPWLEAHFPASEDTAQNYMRLARNTERVRHLDSVRAGIAELVEPRDAEEAEPPAEVESPDWPSEQPSSWAQSWEDERKRRAAREEERERRAARERQPLSEEAAARRAAESATAMFFGYLSNGQRSLEFAVNDLRDGDVFSGRPEVIGEMWSLAVNASEACVEIMEAISEHLRQTGGDLPDD